VLGTALGATALYAMGLARWRCALAGCYGGIFGLLVAIGTLYGDVQFMLFPLPMGIKARYLAAIYALVTVAMLFGQQRMYALRSWAERWRAVLHPAGPAPRHHLPVQRAVVRGAQPLLSLERRRAARKFEVYMRSQGRTVRFDGQGARWTTTRTTRSAGTEDPQRAGTRSQTRICRQGGKRKAGVEAAPFQDKKLPDCPVHAIGIQWPPVQALHQGRPAQTYRM